MAGLWRRWLGRRRGETLETLRRRYQRFQHLIEGNNRVLDLIADAGEKSGGDHVFDRHYLEWLTEELSVAVSAVVYDLNALADNRYGDLVEAFDRICQGVQAVLSPAAAGESDVILSLDNVDRDSANVVGAKMARLGELRSRLRLTVPDGFIASASACRLHFHAAGIDRLIADHGEDLRAPPGPRFEAAASRLRDAVRRTPLDPGVARALRGAIKEPARSEWTYAVRSSALDEDGAHSFAGLHLTLLNVPPSNVADAYRDVLASLFSSQALRYRVENGLPVAEALMAVGFLAMVPTRASGVIHTITPAAPERDLMAVSAAWGLGPTVVQGSGPADSFELSRDPIPRVLSRHIVSKESALASREGAGTEPALVPAGDRATACVSDEELVRLGQIALTIERHAGRYQEIEWSVRQDGEVVILQARGLRAAPSQVRDGAELARLLAGHRAVFRGRGVIACGGVGAGQVVRLRSPDDADGFPSGAVLVAQTPSRSVATPPPVATYGRLSRSK